MKVWITKYALTDGIFSVDAEVNGGMVTWNEEGHFRQHAHGNDWHGTVEGAIDRAEEMREKKIKSLEKSLAKMKALTFFEA